jgi:hypothetical protein
VIATENIFPGQLILVSKALALVYPDKDLETCSQLVKDVKKLGALREAVAALVAADTAASKLIYQLHAGAGEAMTVMDMKRIERICSLNGFESGSTGSSYGLWYLPSFLNHDCSGSNAHWNVFGDFMFVRATKRIGKGEEILISYVDPNQRYALRRKFYLKHEFQCFCKLCKLEKEEGQAIRRRRDILLEDFKDEAPEDPEVIQEYVINLEGLRPENPELNIFLIQPLVQLGLCWYERAKYAEAAEALQRVYAFCKTSAQFVILEVSCAFTIATCFLRLGKKTEAQDWVNRSKSSVLVQYGSASVAEVLRPSFILEVERAELSYK